MSPTDSVYAGLEARFARLGALGEAARVLHWDSAVNMPSGGAAARAEQLAALKLVRRDMLAEDGMAGRLDEAAAEVAGDPWRAANLREMRRIWRRETAVDADLLVARTRAESACEMAWRRARAENDFLVVRSRLEELVDLVRRTGEAMAAVLGGSVYEALMDAFEPGATTAGVDELFDDLAGFLPGFLERALDARRDPPVPAAPAEGYPVEAQRALCVGLMKRLGFDFDRGRLDTSLHPFCGGVPDDIRITTRYDPGDFSQALMGVLHETGHALYEAGLPTRWRRQPVGRARGMAMHESQSLLIEMQVCRSREFAAYLAPLIRDAFSGAGAGWDAEALGRHCLRIRRSLVRVDSDEVTYPSHVLLRYRLERAMIAGDLRAADLPGAWSDGLDDLLGIRPETDREGCLQDIHWYDGAWGYFPTYTMGAAAAAQLYAAARSEIAGLPEAVAEGAFAPLVDWLRDSVHSKGSLFPSTDAALEAATGERLSAAPFKAHLARRYLPC